MESATLAVWLRLSAILAFKLNLLDLFQGP